MKPAFKKIQNLIRNRLSLILLVIALAIFYLLLFTVIWLKKNYANITIEEILVTMNGPIGGANSEYFISFILKVILPALLCLAGTLLLFYAPLKKRLYIELKIFRKYTLINLFPFKMKILPVSLLLIVGYCMLFSNFENTYHVSTYISNHMQESKFIENEYVAPENVDLVFPEEKRNLIWIVMESAESSNQDQANGGVFDINYTPEMTELAKNNISFSQSDQLQGAVVSPFSAGTISGLVTQNAGIPYIENKKSKEFLPGVTTLDDLLDANGYRTYFMCGSDFDFGARKSFFMQHGCQDYTDLFTARADGKIPSDYKVWWGFEDAKLYTYAQEKLLEFSAEDQPFALTLLTVDTHATGGYVCQLCGNTYEKDYANVWNCASRQVDEFVSWIQEQDFYENTTVIITGDHVSMDASFYPATPAGSGIAGVRRVYNAFIHSAVDTNAMKNRRFTTLDFFPTAVASMGIQIPGERLGLGTNLFSGVETLAEQYGYDYLFENLSKRSNYYYDVFINNIREASD
ncbi:MAG: LTA synthase family protein [Clostridiales bacterium]|nr:LTA synthase family protein [Candidatus Blautia equi]